MRRTASRLATTSNGNRFTTPTAELHYCGGVTQHYFSSHPEASPDEMRMVELSFRQRSLQMWVSSKVFSSTRLDPGTAQLLAALPRLPTAGTFLDLGCGWGPIAVSVGKASPEATIWAVDVNQRALALTARNAQINGVTNVVCLLPEDALEQAKRQDLFFDVIISNPPIRIGKAALHALLETWLDRLCPLGTAWLVVNKNLGGDSLIAWLNDSGYTARKFSSRKGFRIIEVHAGDPRR